MGNLSLLNRLASAGVNRQFEESVTVVPRANSDYARGPDPIRQPMAVSAVVSIAREDETLAATNAGGDFRKGRFVGVAESSIWISAAQVALLGYEIATGDQIVLSARPGTPVFTVMFPGPNDLGDMHITITAEPTIPAPSLPLVFR